MKMFLALAMVMMMAAGQSFAQSALRADEKMKDPSSYRLGDSEDLQNDQVFVDQHNDEKREVSDQLKNHGLYKRLIKHNI